MEEQSKVRKYNRKSSSEPGDMVGLTVGSGGKWQTPLANGRSEPVGRSPVWDIPQSQRLPVH